MSATPNPKRKPKRSFAGYVRKYVLTRDTDGNVFTPRGYLPKDDYERVRAERPELGLPAFADLLIV